MPKINPIVLLLSVMLCFNFSLAQDGKLDKLTVFRLLAQSDSLLIKSRYKASLQRAKIALDGALALKDDKLLVLSYNAIAGNLEDIEEIDKAIHYYRKALYYCHKSENDSLKVWINSNLGNVYVYEKQDYDKGIELYLKAISFAEKIKDTSSLVLAKLNLANAYFKKGTPSLTADPLAYANANIDKLGYPESYVFLDMLNGKRYSDLNDSQKANFYFNKAIIAGLKYNTKSQLLDSYAAFSRHLYKKEDYKNAYHYKNLEHQLEDDIFNDEKLKSAQFVSSKIEIDEYQRTINKIEQERAKQQKTLRESKIIVVLFLVLLIVLLLLIWSLFKNIKFKKQANAELLQANEALQLAKEKAEEASQLKTQFVSTITHELRTPLYGVVGITNILLDEHKELANSPHLKSLKFSAKYLLSLVNDILQINKIEENRITLENLIFNLPDEITSLKTSLDFIANRNFDELIVEIDTAIPEFLIGDKLRLSQILMNLVSNALKFTKHGKVVISADLERVEGTKYYIAFKVSDNGIGIAPEDQEKIFEKFVQIERKEEDYQGTGLGLSIVKRLIELFQSEIHLESTENVGTTFSFTIGFEYDKMKSVDIINNIEVDLSTSQLFTVLVVEDNKINQVVTKKIIEKSNLRCTIVDDGYAAMVALEREHFDLVLMDINMPLINGFETTRRIRAKGITIPIIALTAFDKQEVIEEAIASGMNDIIVKPFEPVKLFQVISDQIHNKK